MKKIRKHLKKIENILRLFFNQQLGFYYLNQQYFYWKNVDINFIESLHKIRENMKISSIKKIKKFILYNIENESLEEVISKLKKRRIICITKVDKIYDEDEYENGNKLADVLVYNLVCKYIELLIQKFEKKRKTFRCFVFIF